MEIAEQNSAKKVCWPHCQTYLCALLCMYLVFARPENQSIATNRKSVLRSSLFRRSVLLMQLQAGIRRPETWSDSM